MVGAEAKRFNRNFCLSMAAIILVSLVGIFAIIYLATHPETAEAEIEGVGETFREGTFWVNPGCYIKVKVGATRTMLYADPAMCLASKPGDHMTVIKCPWNSNKWCMAL